ncbi:unnamed protein product [Clavelina lepadiformis]|uniref:Uncharacterized protein n=1 Tax=Clavelina lepadiformis TaxID=159417 RepID=A0ABP0G9J5_CLALP
MHHSLGGDRATCVLTPKAALRRELSDDADYNNGHDLRRLPTSEAAGIVPRSRSMPLTTNQQLAPPPWRTNIHCKKMQQRAGDANNDNQSQTPYKVVMPKREIFQKRELVMTQ